MNLLAEVAAIADMAGYLGIIPLFICFGLAHKMMGEKRGFATYLFSLWKIFWREIAIEKPSTYFAAFKSIAEGGSMETLAVKGSEGQKYLLPKRRREIMKQIREFEHIWKKEFGARIVLDNTALQFGFYADADGLDELEKELEMLGDLIEEEKAAFFTDDYWDNKRHLVFFEIIFSDEGRVAKRRMVPDRSRMDEEATKWFWCGVLPSLILSLFIVHWAIWGIFLVGTFFLYIRELEDVKQIRRVTSDERKIRDEDISPDRQ